MITTLLPNHYRGIYHEMKGVLEEQVVGVDFKRWMYTAPHTKNPCWADWINHAICYRPQLKKVAPKSQPKIYHQVPGTWW